mmetsp:Transcript_1391/g.4568  ORF Transcript_1391/g.4568 Transcript_1391/m.4568 type:complete len:341 (-) Transcript_1391:502-1524(-)
MFVEHRAADGHVCGPERAEAARERLVRQLEHLDQPRHGVPRAKRREANINQLLRVQRAMPVLAKANRLWDDDAGRVRGLEDAGEVAAARDLADKHGRKALGAQLLVHAQEVHLARREPVAVDDDLGGRRADEGDELPARAHAHADVPLELVAGRHHRPLDERLGILKPEHGLRVLHVVLLEERVELRELGVVVQPDGRPLEACRQLKRLLGHGGDVGWNDRPARLVWAQLRVRHPRDGLRVPERVVVRDPARARARASRLGLLDGVLQLGDLEFALRVLHTAGLSQSPLPAARPRLAPRGGSGRRRAATRVGHYCRVEARSNCQYLCQSRAKTGNPRWRR